MRFWRTIQRRLRRYIVYRLSWSTKSFLIAGGFWLLHLVLFTWYQRSPLELSLLDRWYSVRGPVSPPSSVALVEITERTYTHFGRTLRASLPRTDIATIVEHIAALKPRLLIIDSVFAGSTDPEEDRALANALRRIPTAIGAYVKPSTYGAKSSLEMVELNPELKNGASLITSILLPLGSDDVVRSLVVPEVPEDFRYGVARAVRIAVDRDAPMPEADDLIRYYGPARTIPSVDAADVVRPDADGRAAELIRDRVVLLGYRVLTSHSGGAIDQFRAPVPGSKLFGVEIHATIAANILERSWIRRLPADRERALLGALAFTMAFVIIRLRPPAGGLVLMGVIAAWASASYLLFLHGFFLPGVTLMVYLAPVMFAVNATYSYSIVQRQLSELNAALGMESAVKK